MSRRSQRGSSANGEMARVEQIKRFKLLPAEWQPGGDELTPTMKLKRKPITAKYAAEIEQLYVRPAGTPGVPDTLGVVSSTRQIDVGGVKIGGGAPVAVQSMTKTETADYDATMRQIHAIAEAGGDMVRCAVPRDKDVEALKRIVRESPIPVIADIHFNHTLALKAIDAGAHCIRINPGNIGGPRRPVRWWTRPTRRACRFAWA